MCLYIQLPRERPSSLYNLPSKSSKVAYIELNRQEEEKMKKPKEGTGPLSAMINRQRRRDKYGSQDA